MPTFTMIKQRGTNGIFGENFYITFSMFFGQINITKNYLIQKSLLKEHALDTITPLDIGENFGRYAELRANLISEKTGNELDKRLMEKTKELRTMIEKKKNNEQSQRSSNPRPSGPSSTTAGVPSFSANYQNQPPAAVLAHIQSWLNAQAHPYYRPIQTNEPRFFGHSSNYGPPRQQ
jgi:hypothetical protein